MTVAEELERGAATLGLDLPADAARRLVAYLELIEKWNRVYNLTAVRDRQKMVSHHLLDCLGVLPHIAAGSILDVGSGAGLPGIPLALMRPGARVTLIERNRKKAVFLQQAVIELELHDMVVVCGRIEAWHPPERFQTVISRAFSDLTEYLALAGRLCASEGVIAAMKGVYPHEELSRLPPEYRLKKVVPLRIPGLRAERHLVLLESA